jgi:hypothetical protein
MLPGVLFAIVLQTLPTGVQGVVNDLLATEPTTAALYGASGLLSVGGVRYLIKRRASDAVDQATSGTSIKAGASNGQSSTTTTTTTTAGASGTKHNVAFTIPGFVPLSHGVRSVTHHEIHAVELGAVVGLAATWLYSTGRTELVTGIVVAFLAGTLGYKRYSSKAFKTVRYEPWYALVALAAGAALGAALFMGDTAVLTIPDGWLPS